MERFKAVKKSPSNFFVLEKDEGGNIEIDKEAIDTITQEPLEELGDPIFASENGKVYHPFRRTTFRDYVNSFPPDAEITDPMTRRVLFPNKRAFSVFDSEEEANEATEPSTAESPYVLKGPVMPMDGQWAVMWILVY